MKNLYLLPTEKPSILGRFIDTNNLFLRVSNDIPRGENVNIYITSDEKIKNRDWCLYNKNHNSRNPDWILTKCGEIESEEMHPISEGKLLLWMKKIILTTDQDLIEDGVQAIDDEFLEWFVKNPSCEFVKVVDGLYFDGVEWISCYKIIIPKEELNYNVKQIKKNSLQDTQFEHELQARIYEVLKKNNNSSIELQSSKLVECVTDYFNHIECTFVIKNGDKTNVKKGKLV